MASPWEVMRITATAQVMDGDVLREMPTRAVGLGSSKNIPMIIGTNLEEWKLFLFGDLGKGKLDRAQIIERLGRFIPPQHAAGVVEHYYKARSNRQADKGPIEILSAINTDVMFRMPALQLVEAQLQHNPNVYNYLFAWPSPIFGGALGACHALEMGFVFGTHDDNFCGSGADADQLSEGIQDAWASFARTGNPSCKSLGDWPAYGDLRSTMILDNQCRIEEAPYEEERLAWDKVGKLYNILL